MADVCFVVIDLLVPYVIADRLKGGWHIYLFCICDNMIDQLINSNKTFRLKAEETQFSMARKLVDDKPLKS